MTVLEAGRQVKEAGLATHFIPSSHLPLIKQQLQAAGAGASDLATVNDILSSLEVQAEAAGPQGTAAGTSGSPGPSAHSLMHLLPIINRLVGG